MRVATCALLVVLSSPSPPLWAAESAESEWQALESAALAQANAGELEQARQTAEQAAALARREFGADPRTAKSLALLGEVLTVLQQWAPAETVLREAMAMRERVLAPGDFELEQSCNLLARALAGQGQYEEAERLQLAAVAASEKAVLAGAQGPVAPRWTDLIANLRNLTRYYVERGDQAKARALRQRAVAALARHAAADPEDHLLRLGMLVQETTRAEDYEDAEAIVRERLRLVERHFGKQHSQYAHALYQQAKVRRGQDDTAAANRLDVEALAAAEGAFAADDPELALYLLNAGMALLEPATVARAETLLRRALTLYEADDPASDSTARSADGLAEAYEMQGRFAPAEPLRLKVVTLREGVYGARHALTIYGVAYAADNLFWQGKWAAAGAHYQRVVAALAAGVKVSEYLVLNRLGRGVEAAVRTGEHGAAAAAWRQMIELRRHHLGDRHPRVAAAHREVAALQRVANDEAAARDSERRAEAIEVSAKDGQADRAGVPPALQHGFDEDLLGRLEPALADLEVRLDPASATDAVRLAAAIELRGELRLTTGNLQSAAGEYEKALSLRLRGHGKGHADTLRNAERLAELYRKLGKPELAQGILKRAGLGAP